MAGAGDTVVGAGSVETAARPRSPSRDELCGGSDIATRTRPLQSRNLTSQCSRNRRTKVDNTRVRSRSKRNTIKRRKNRHRSLRARFSISVKNLISSTAKDELNRPANRRPLRVICGCTKPGCGHGLAAGNRHSTLTTASISKSFRLDPMRVWPFFYFAARVRDWPPVLSIGVTSPLHSLTPAWGF